MMYKSITIISVLSAVVVVFFVGSMMTNAYADYEESGFRLTHNPMICIYDPAPNSSFPNLSLDLSRITRDAISNWSIHDPLHPTAWNIYSDEISYDKVATFNSAKCDITISFLPSPTSSPDQTELVGDTIYDFTNHKAKIEIYYLALETQIHTKTVLNAYVYYWYTVSGYDTNHIAPEGQISQALRHELGHAFGLGHYIISEQDENTIVKFGQQIPSVMMPLMIQQTRNNFDSVSQSDIQELESLYSVDGFNSPIPQTPVSQSIPSVPTPLSSANPTPQSTIVIPATLKNEVRDWSMDKIGNEGFDNFVKYLDLVQVIKVQPATQNANSQIVIPSWIKKNTKLWLSGDMSDNDYFMTIQYMINNKIIILSDLPTYANNDSSSQVQNFGSCPQDQVEQFLSLKKQIDTLRPQIQTMPKVFSTQSQYDHYYNLISQYNDLIEKYNNIAFQFDDSNCMNK